MEPARVVRPRTAGQRLREVGGFGADRAAPHGNVASRNPGTSNPGTSNPGTQRAPRHGALLHPLALPSATLLVALALLAATLLLSLRDPGADARSGRSAAAQAKLSLEQMLSFDYRTFDADSARVQPLLAGPFRSEFTATMAAQIKPLAQRSKSVVRARVYDVGVVSASDRSVTVLAFVNQAKTSSDLERPAIDQNRVIATLTRVDGRWLISGLKAF